MRHSDASLSAYSSSARESSASVRDGAGCGAPCSLVQRHPRERAFPADAADHRRASVERRVSALLHRHFRAFGGAGGARRVPPVEHGGAFVRAAAGSLDASLGRGGATLGRAPETPFCPMMVLPLRTNLGALRAPSATRSVVSALGGGGVEVAVVAPSAALTCMVHLFPSFLTPLHHPEVRAHAELRELRRVVAHRARPRVRDVRAVVRAELAVDDRPQRALGLAVVIEVGLAEEEEREVVIRGGEVAELPRAVRPPVRAPRARASPAGPPRSPIARGSPRGEVLDAREPQIRELVLEHRRRHQPVLHAQAGELLLVSTDARALRRSSRAFDALRRSLSTVSNIAQKRDDGCAARGGASVT